MTTPLLKHWQAYWELEPFGGAHEDYRAGWTAMLLHNANCGKGKEKEMGYFFKSLREPAPEYTDEELMRQVDATMIAQGGVKG